MSEARDWKQISYRPNLDNASIFRCELKCFRWTHPLQSSLVPSLIRSYLILDVESVTFEVWWVRMLGIGKPDRRTLRMERVYFRLLLKTIKPSLILTTDFQGLKCTFWKTWWGVLFRGRHTGREETCVSGFSVSFCIPQRA